MFSKLRVVDVSHWVKSAIAALILHCAVLGAFLIQTPLVDAKPPPSPAAMVVELAALPSAPPTPQTDIPDGPKQFEVRREPPKILKWKQKFTLPPEVKTLKPPDLTLVKKSNPHPDDAQEEKRAVEQTTAPPTLNAAPDMKSAASVVGTSSAPSATPQMTWENRILVQLEHNKRYPRESRFRHEQDVVYVRFVMNRQGEVLSSSIVRSLGYSLLDSEVLALVKRAGPFPPPPPEISGEQIEMVVPVEFYISHG